MKNNTGEISMAFCERCGTMKQKIVVSDNMMPIPFCPVCQIEIKHYFLDESNHFIHFGNWDLFDIWKLGFGILKFMKIESGYNLI